MQRIFVSMFFLLLLSACTKYTTVRQSANFKKSDLETSKFIVLPSEAIAYEKGYFGQAKRLYDYEAHIETLVTDKLVSHLQSMGYDAISLSQYEIYKSKISPKMLELRELYQPAIIELYKEVIMPQEEAHNIVSKINVPYEVSQLALLKLGNKNKALLVFCDYSHTAYNNSARVMSSLMALVVGEYSNDDTASIRVGIVNSDTGEILWSNDTTISAEQFRGTFSGYNEESDNAMADSLVKLVLSPIIHDTN